jgi:hypothetical protein
MAAMEGVGKMSGTKLEHGAYYWVKFKAGAEWEPALHQYLWKGTVSRFYPCGGDLGDSLEYILENGGEIGKQIPAPEDGK